MWLIFPFLNKTNKYPPSIVIVLQFLFACSTMSKSVLYTVICKLSSILRTSAFAFTAPLVRTSFMDDPLLKAGKEGVSFVCFYCNVTAGEKSSSSLELSAQY